MIKVVTIIGARPQFIKAAVVSRIFLESKKISEIIIHTGQHYDSNMSDVFFQEMQIPKPNYNLNVNGLTHGAMTGQMLEKIENVLVKEQPDWVLVYGDTNSTLAGALAAKKMHIKVAHVEAGLRSYNMLMPEEINRILTDRISDVLFCPTKEAIHNLLNEGYNNIKSKCIVTGDVMQDAAIFYNCLAKKPNFNIASEFILCTVHREENTDNIDKLRSIFNALEVISKNKLVIIPLHPRTRGKLLDIQYDFENTNIMFTNPVGYLEMVWLLKNCIFVMTDSGGLQKESYFFNKFCITLREQTEWIELLHNKCNVLVGSEYKLILNAVSDLDMQNSHNFTNNLYGKGNAGDVILQSLLTYNNKI